MSRFFAGNFALAGLQSGRGRAQPTELGQRPPHLPVCRFFFSCSPRPPQRPPGQGTVTAPSKGPLPHPTTRSPWALDPSASPPTPPPGRDPTLPFSEAETAVRLRKGRETPAHSQCSAKGNRVNEGTEHSSKHTLFTEEETEAGWCRAQAQSPASRTPGPASGEVSLECPQGLWPRV